MAGVARGCAGLALAALVGTTLAGGAPLAAEESVDGSVSIAVLFPADAQFDMDYYMDHHLPLILERWRPMGLSGVRVMQGVGTADGGPPVYQVVVLTTFESMEAFQRAAEAHGEEITGDIVNFSDAHPIIQVNELVADE